MHFIPLSSALDSKAKLKVLAFVCSDYSSMGEREIARVVGLSHMSVNRIMRGFHELDLVYPKRVGSAIVWEKKGGSLAAVELERVVGILQGLPSPVEHLVETISAGLAGQRVIRAAVFGSVAEGTERPGSDIDLFVLVPDEAARENLSAGMDLLRNKCLELYGNSLSPLIMTSKEFARPTNKHLVQSLAHGRIIPVPKAGK